MTQARIGVLIQAGQREGTDKNNEYYKRDKARRVLENTFLCG